MNNALRKALRSLCCLWIVGNLSGSISALADDISADAGYGGVRYEISLGTHVWPGVGDLQGTNGGSFDAMGFNLGGAIHWPVRTLANGELLLGMELVLQSNDSDIRLFTEDLSFRNLAIGPSLKWAAGRSYRYSVDLGVAYHEADIAELVGVYPDYWETVIWDERALGVFIGASLNFNAGTPEKRRGAVLAFKTHFVDFDIEAGNLLLAQTLGPGSGNVAGPIYSLAVGYRWR